MRPQDTSTKHDIAVVISTLGPGGAERNVHDLVETWSDFGLRIAVITFSDPTEDFYVLPRQVTRISLDAIRPSSNVLDAFRANVRRILGLRAALKDAAAPRVLSCIGATNVLAIVASRGLGVHTVVFETNDPAKQSLGAPWNALRRGLYRFADCVASNTKGSLEAMAGYVPRRKLSLTPNPLRKRESPALPREPLIVNVGSLTYQKGHDILLRAFAVVASSIPSWRLAIVGGGPLSEELQTLSSELEIDDRVEWEGVVADPYDYYDRASIFVLPSRFEGLPNVMLEAMSRGVPVIVSDASPGPLEYVNHRENGLVFRSEDAPDLARAIRELADDPGLRARLGSTARASVQSNMNEAIRAWDRAIGLTASL